MNYSTQSSHALVSVHRYGRSFVLQRTSNLALHT
jgi:hypothetical protein